MISQSAVFRASFPSNMPDIKPGATPILCGSLQDGDMIHQKAVSMIRDPYSYGFCVGFRWEARVGGAVTRLKALRLLRIR